MTEVARIVTVIGRVGRADVMLPADRPLTEFLPILAPMVAGRPDAGEGLVRLDGRTLDGGQSLAAQGVADGTILLLRHPDPTVREPLLHDGGARSSRAMVAPRTWGRDWWRQTLAAACAALVAAAGIGQLLVGPVGAPDAAGLLVAGVLAAVAGGLVARGLDRRWSGGALALAALAPWLAGAVFAARLAGMDPLAAAAVGAVALSLGALAVIGLAGETVLVPALAAAIAAAVTALVAAVTAALGSGPTAAAAALVPVALACLRPAPKLAARATGLLSPGVPGSGEEALAARISRARKLLTAAAAGIAAAVALACAELAAAGGGYGIGLAAAAALVLLLEARHFRFAGSAVPVVVAGLAAGTAAAAGALAGPLQPVGAGALPAVLGAAVVLAAAGVIGGRRELPAGIAIHLGKVEAAATIPLVPLAFGVAGVYPMVAALVHRLAG